MLQMCHAYSTMNKVDTLYFISKRQLGIGMFTYRLVAIFWRHLLARDNQCSHNADREW